MERLAELIKIDNMLHNLVVKLSSDEKPKTLEQVLQITDPKQLSIELSKFDPSVIEELNKVLGTIKKSFIPPLLEQAHVPDLIQKMLPQISTLQNLGILKDLAPRLGILINAQQKMNTPTPKTLSTKVKGDPIFGGTSDVKFTGTAPTFGGLTNGPNFSNVPMTGYTPKYTGYGHSKGLKKLNESDANVKTAATELPDLGKMYQKVLSIMQNQTLTEQEKENLLNAELLQTGNKYGIPAQQYYKSK
jgi:hypothetical protein